MQLTRSTLENMNEDDLRKKVLIPLFKAMGFRDVFEYHGGVLELGKDIVMWKEGALKDRTNFGVVVKAKKVSGSTSGARSVADVKTQIEQTLTTPYKDPVTTNDEKVHQCLVVCPIIKKEALNAIQGPLKLQHLERLTRFIHDEILWNLIEKYLLPKQNVVSELKDVLTRLDQVSQRFKVTPDFGEELSLSFDERYPGALREHPLELNGRFEFPDTPEGRKASDELKTALTTGKPATIPHKFVKDFNMPEELKELFGFDNDIQPIGVEVKSSIPGQKKPLLIRMEVHQGGELTAAHGYLELKPKRGGTEEITYSNTDQPVPYKITMAINRRSKNISMSWTIEHHGANVHLALQALRFHEAVASGGELPTPVVTWTDAPVRILHS